MRRFGFNVTAGVLVALMAASASLVSQAPVTMTVAVEDSRGAALKEATVKDATGYLLGRTDEEGRVTLQCSAPCRLRVGASGFSDQILLLSAGTTVRLDPAGAAEQVTVTAYRAPLGALESPANTLRLTQNALNTTASITLDGQLRQLPGAELFRRSSSLVANPSSQGMSLRGLGSTSASRTLLTEDDVPLNDPIGGWIHWEEQPELALKSIELVRGGVSDLYGSSAIGGVVNLVPMRPTSDMVEVRSSYGGEGAYDESLLAQTKHGPWGLLVAGGAMGTDGYVMQAPWLRGPVDRPSTLDGRNGTMLAEHDRGSLRLFLRGSGFSESRGNGTAYQKNGTRVWRYATGADWQGPRNGTLTARFYGSDEHFRQTFSSVSSLPVFGESNCTKRCSEIPTRYSLTPDNELGATVHWSQPLAAGLMMVAGADSHYVKVWDREEVFGTPNALTNLQDRQLDSAAYVEGMWVHKAWTVTSAGRMDWYKNFDGQQWQVTGSSWGPTDTQPPPGAQQVFDPRLGVSRKLWNHWALSATGFRAFRAPTPNELYRPTQVGNKLTNPNGTLQSERATGWETGIATEWRWGGARASYFLTQVNRPITAVTVNTSSSPILLLRENLGQIESRGVAVDFQIAPRRWLAVDGGYQHAQATVTRGMQDLGNWIPEVARNLATLNLRAYRPSLGSFNLQGRLSGRQYDDDANIYMLHGYFRLDAYASHDFGKRFQMFTAGENLLNRQIEVAKTPSTTLGMPRTARVGLLIRLGGTAK